MTYVSLWCELHNFKNCAVTYFSTLEKVSSVIKAILKALPRYRVVKIICIANTNWKKKSLFSTRVKLEECIRKENRFTLPPHVLKLWPVVDRIWNLFDLKSHPFGKLNRTRNEYRSHSSYIRKKRVSTFFIHHFRSYNIIIRMFYRMSIKKFRHIVTHIKILHKIYCCET